ncbi:MAG: flavin reductase family protein [Phycisphaerales bacterium]
MSSAMPAGVREAFEVIAGARFVMTSCFETRREGVMCSWVTPCAHTPALVCAAVRRGHPIEPVIRDSRRFALCRVEAEDRLVDRAFGARRTGDPFDGLEVDHLATPSPVLCRSSLVFDCEVYRHLDIEADHELYIGLVVACRRSKPRERSR